MEVPGEPGPTSQTFQDAQTQWSDPAMEDHTYSKGPTITCAVTSLSSSESLQPVVELTLKDDTDCLLYTGIPLLEFKTLVSCLQHFAPKSSALPAEDQILLTLMKLRKNFVFADLAKRFKMSPGQVSKTLKFWIDVIAVHTQDLIPWLPRETIKATLPQVFMDSFPNTTCMIDRTESVLQKAKNLDSRTESYTHYYASNTVKYLVATAPSGIVMYISEAYGGKCSDRFITQNSGFLDHLRAGDEVMGDRGFTIRDLLEERNVGLIMPAFTRKKSQLTNEQVTRTRSPNVHIHIERAIRRLKVYKILSQTVPIHFVTKIDKILKICAALVNLRGELISRK
uniref:DDE Tnp4 domain-containing protein n=1 Tax=Sander lucioperca TaxID=283035 RepID=A0A8C9Z9W7_SANLU